MMSPRSANSSRSLKCRLPHRRPGSEESCLLAPAMRECVFFVPAMASQGCHRGCSQGRSPHWQVIGLLLRTHNDHPKVWFRCSCGRSCLPTVSKVNSTDNFQRGWEELKVSNRGKIRQNSAKFKHDMILTPVFSLEFDFVH